MARLLAEKTDKEPMAEGKQTLLWEQISGQWISSIKEIMSLLKDK